MSIKWLEHLLNFWMVGWMQCFDHCTLERQSNSGKLSQIISLHDEGSSVISRYY